MHIILLETPPTIEARLRKMGIAVLETDNTYVMASPRLLTKTDALSVPRIWVWGGGDRPPLRDGDYLIDACSTPPANDEMTVGLSWSDNLHAVEYGFRTLVGGSATAIAQVRPILDALAPVVSGWLYVGGPSAPQFVQTVLTEISTSLSHMAAATMVMPDTNWATVIQSSLLVPPRLAEIAQNYLALTTDECYEPALQVLDSSFAVPGIGSDESTARKLAALLIWLYQSQHPVALNTRQKTTP